jgi:hypothetical protein
MPSVYCIIGNKVMVEALSAVAAKLASLVIWQTIVQVALIFAYCALMVALIGLCFILYAVAVRIYDRHTKVRLTGEQLNIIYSKLNSRRSFFSAKGNCILTEIENILYPSIVGLIPSTDFPADDYKVTIGEIKQIYEYLMKKRHSKEVAKENAGNNKFFYKDGLLGPQWAQTLTFLKLLQDERSLFGRGDYNSDRVTVRSCKALHGRLLVTAAVLKFKVEDAQYAVNEARRRKGEAIKRIEEGGNKLGRHSTGLKEKVCRLGGLGLGKLGESLQGTAWNRLSQENKKIIESMAQGYETLEEEERVLVKAELALAELALAEAQTCVLRQHNNEQPIISKDLERGVKGCGIIVEIERVLVKAELALAELALAEAQTCVLEIEMTKTATFLGRGPQHKGSLDAKCEVGCVSGIRLGDLKGVRAQL